MTAPEQQSYLAQTTEGLPSTRASLQQLPPILAQFAGSMGTVTHPNLYPVHEYPAVVEAFDKGIQSILIGEQTPEQVAVEVQRIKEKELAKAQPGSF
jgi:maltose-binding protein MalE